MNSILDISSQLEEVDWSFASFNNSGIHSFHWYPATFISAIPGTMIPMLTKKGDVVLDPFCGSCTTGVESIRLGRNFIGMDTNPIALLISEARLLFPDPKRLAGQVSDVINEMQVVKVSEDPESHPQFQELRGWYHPETLSELNALLNIIISIESSIFRKCLLAIFSAILKTASSQGRHWGWVCDNVKPKGSEIVYKDVASIFLNTASEYIKYSEATFKSAMQSIEGLSRKSIRGNYSLRQGDCIKRMSSIDSDSIDLILTSPPYYGVADYVKSQRLSYLWFDMDSLSSTKLGFRNFENLRRQEAGSRSHRHRKDSHQQYMSFMSSFFGQCSRILKDRSRVALIVGESKSRKNIMEELIDTAAEYKLQLELRRQRDIKATRRRLMAKVQDEDILIFENKS